MRRGGGYSNQSGSLLQHNGPPTHGPHQNQAQQQQQQQNGRMGPNRMYHHQQQQPHHHQAQAAHHQQNLQTLQTLQNLQNLQQQPQMVPYGNQQRLPPLQQQPPPQSSFPLSSGAGATNSLTSLALNSNNHQHIYPPGSGVGVSSNLLSLSSNGGGGGLNPTISGSSSSSVVVVGGDMPPVETVVARLETACRLLHGIGGNHTRVNEIGVEIQILSEDLRRVGPLLETAYPDVLDRVMSSMRDASAQPSLPPSLRLAIFELVELRASKWMLPSDSSNYYRQRRNINDSVDLTPDGPSSHHQHHNHHQQHHHYNSCNNSQSINNSSSVGGSGNATTMGRTSGSILVGGCNNSLPKPEVIFQSDLSSSSPLGPSPIPSNSTTSETSTSNNAKAFREEVLIKNSDSGKVAPSAKERVLSINGYSQQSINMAKQLIQETIQRNSSPVFDGLVSNSGHAGSEYSLGDGDELMDATGGIVSGLKKLSTNSAKGGEDVFQRFCYSVNLGDDILRISGSNLQFVQEAKFSLDDYFSQKYPELFYASNVDVEEEEDEEILLDEVQLVPKYDRMTLLNLSLAKMSMPNFFHLSPEVRTAIVLERPRNFDPEKFSKEMSTGGG